MSKGIVVTSFLITQSEQVFSISVFSMYHEMGQPYQLVYNICINLP